MWSQLAGHASLRLGRKIPSPRAISFPDRAQQPFRPAKPNRHVCSARRPALGSLQQTVKVFVDRISTIEIRSLCANHSAVWFLHAAECIVNLIFGDGRARSIACPPPTAPTTQRHRRRTPDPLSRNVRYDAAEFLSRRHRLDAPCYRTKSAVVPYSSSGIDRRVAGSDLRQPDDPSEPLRHRSQAAAR